MIACQMCCREAPLCKAHLFPRALRKFVSEDRNSPFFEISVTEGQPPKGLDTFEFDRNILCSQCDGYLGNFDRAFVEFVAAWQHDPIRWRSLVHPPSFETLRLQRDPIPLRFGILASLYRFAISERHPEVALSPVEIRILRDILIQNDPEPRAFPVFINGYYRCDMLFGGKIIDITRIGRPHPAKSPGGFYFELFGLTIHISVDPNTEWRRIANRENQKLIMTVNGVEESSPSFDHFYRHMLGAGAVIMPTQMTDLCGA